MKVRREIEVDVVALELYELEVTPPREDFELEVKRTTQMARSDKALSVDRARELYRRFGTDPTRMRPSSEALLRRLKKGEPLPRINSLVDVANALSVQLQVPAFPNKTFTGTVRSIAPTIDSKSRTAAVRVEPADGATGQLRAGMFARLNIVTAEKANALVVPKAAVLAGAPTGTSQPLVITIDPSGLVHRQPVKIGLQNDQFAEILTGIDDGQMVATSSLNDLADGDIVSPQLQPTTTADVLHR